MTSTSHPPPPDHVDLLARQFHQQVDSHLLPLPQGRAIVHPAVQSAIYEHMFNEASVWPIPPANYQTRVLKTIISRIEDAISDPDEDEIHPDLISAWSTLISQPKSSTIQQAQQLTYIKYTAPWPPPSSTPLPSNTSSTTPSTATSNSRSIITSESRGLILASGTTGFRTWEAALHLATYLSSTSAGEALVKGKRVIELGAGTGMVSMFCAKHLHPRSVLATDREIALIENIRDCAGKNHLVGKGEGEFGAAVWEWGTPLELEGDVDGGSGGDDEEEAGRQEYRGSTDANKDAKTLQFDVALGADLIYDTDLIPLLISTLHDLFTNYGIQEFLISATLRNQDTFAAFLKALEENRFRADQVPFESSAPEEQMGFFHSTDVPIRMYRITRKEDI